MNSIPWLTYGSSVEGQCASSRKGLSDYSVTLPLGVECCLGNLLNIVTSGIGEVMNEFLNEIDYEFIVIFNNASFSLKPMEPLL